MAKTGNTAGEYAAIWDGARWVSIRGDKGDPGQLVIKGSVASPADLPATGTPGEVWLASGNLYSWDDTTSKWIDGGRLQGPQGPQGPSGTPGRDGIDGVSTTVRVGTVSEGPLSVTNTGTASQAVINFTIPKGDAGPAGPAGADGVVPTISIGTTSVLPSGSSATVTKTGTASNVVLSFGIPTGPAGSAGATGLKGDPGVAGPAGSVGPAGAAGAAGKDGAAGAAGKDGAAASLAIGTVSTLDAGKPATVSNSGTSSAAVINFGLPQGTQGLQGPTGADGAAATIAIGTVTSGTKAAVTNSGTASAAIINFTVPKGDTGAAGADGKDGAGVTIKGTLTGAATALPTAVAGDMYLLGDPVPTAAPSPAVGAKVAGDGIVYNGTTWSNVGPIRGPAGPAGVAGAKGADGPTAVSADAHNYSKLGTDNKLFTPTPDIPAAATALPLADGKAAVLGVSTKYAREDHVHILPTLTALGAADASHTHAASTDITGLSKVATSGKYTDLTDTPTGFTLPTATDKILGGIKVGTGLTITGDVLSASGTTSPDASTTVKGIVQLADAAAITAGTASRAVDAAHLKTALDLKAPLASPTFTGKVTIPAGNGANPGLLFTGDSDTGFYLPTANAIGVLAGGAQVLTVATTGVTVTGNLASTGPLTAGGGRSLFTSKNEPFVVGARQSETSGYVYFGATDATSTPGVQLSSAGGASLLSVSNAGNITSTGTAHSFAAASIARSAVAGIAETDLDTRYVNVAGDTVTGRLVVHPTTGSATGGGFLITGEDAGAAADIMRFSSAAAGPRVRFTKGRGTIAAPAVVASNDSCGEFVWYGTLANGTAGTAGTLSIRATAAPLAGEASVKGRMEFTVGNGTLQATPLTLTADGATFLGNVTATGTITANNVTATGTTKTVALEVSSASTLNGPIIANPTYGIGMTMALTSPSATSQATGMALNILPIASKTSSGLNLDNKGFGTDSNYGLSINSLPVGANNWALYIVAPAQNYLKGNLGINWTTPTSQLEVNGTTKLRGALDVTGNITSTGTAHSFAAKSIPASAISGLTTPSFKADDLTDVTVTTPAAGQVLRWNGTAFVNAALNYSDLTGTAPSGGLTQADADNRYVNITGDTVTGDLIINGKVGVGVTPLIGFHVKSASITLEGFVSSQAVRAAAPSNFGGVGVIDSQSIVSGDATAATGSCTAVFARTRGTDTNPALPRVGDFAFRSEGPAPSQLGGDLSVAGNLIGERPYLSLTGSRALALDDRSANIVNLSTGATPVTITLPTNASAPFPIGSRFDIFGLSTTSATVISAVAGVTLNWNATLTGGAAAVAGGVGASLSLPGPLYRVTLIKTAINTWIVLN